MAKSASSESVGPAPTAVGTELGDLTRSIDSLRDRAAFLFASFENDDPAYDLARTAEDIAGRAERIRITLALMGDALQNLEV